VIKHTPGPWIVRVFKSFRGMRDDVWVMDSIPDVNTQVVANAIATCAASNPAYEANARMLAAAPEMYDALASLALMAAAMDMHDMERIARDAMAKAETT
jgi:hypothetical protein